MAWKFPFLLFSFTSYLIVRKWLSICWSCCDKFVPCQTVAITLGWCTHCKVMISLLSNWLYIIHSDDLLFLSYIHLKLHYNYIMFYVYLFTVERLDKKLVDVISLFEISFSQNNIKKSSWSSWMSSLTRIASF